MQKNAKCGLLRLRMLSGAVGVVNALGAQCAVAEGAADTSAAANAGNDVLEEVVVTGTNTAQKVLDTSYAVTAINQDQLKTTPALGLAALASLIPGLYGEAIDIRLPLSQEELASWAGASVESVGRALQQMRKLGWVQTRRRAIRVLDRAALEGVAN